ncbi:hypothetical protein M422DRAFT_153388 [Sphaerobolus stellatus SS14]|nr:hypothetical protein M422DRAFT_153388 [Sphaerobolus stellatus SS14]
MSRQQHQYEHVEDDEEDDDEEGGDEEEEEEEEEEDDDFVPRRRAGDDDDDEDAEIGPGPAKRARYSPSAANGITYARASPPAQAPRPHPQKSSSYATKDAIAAAYKSARKPHLENSILNVEPVDELIREVADFVHKLIMGCGDAEHVEIEAKVGVLRDQTGQRIRLPVGTETVLLPDTPGIRFESNMHMSQHHHYNTLLNGLGVPPPSGEVQRTPLKYVHTKLTDSFYAAPDNGRDKIRVTTDETGRIVQCIRKVRLGDMNIYSPKRNADWRISVNLELPEQQPSGSLTLSRKKDRMTYTHQYCNIDLTQVKQTAGAGNAAVQHELELEFNPSAMPVIMHAASRRNSPDSSVSVEQKNEYDDIIRVFVNNARILVRNASNAWER